MRYPETRQFKTDLNVSFQPSINLNTASVDSRIRYPKKLFNPVPPELSTMKIVSLKSLIEKQIPDHNPEFLIQKQNWKQV